MECFQSTIKLPIDSYERQKNLLSKNDESCCFFDIETTGLSPDISNVYLIGAAFLTNGTISLTQWFADDYISEQDLLLAFANFCKSFQTIFHYNGNTFDIPYLEKKYDKYHIASPFKNIRTLDLYQMAKKYKDSLPCSNLKLTSVERLFSFRRQDSFTGKDCIMLYTNYMQEKYFRKESMKDTQKKLLLHNHDDLIGTILCSGFLSYHTFEITQCNYLFQDTTLEIHLQTTWSFPMPVTTFKDSVKITYRNNQCILFVPVFKGVLKHYYSDYKDYFYLPKEDMAVHKSVGIFVDKEYRKKATASTCYIKKEGTFLPLPKKHLFLHADLFKENKRTATSYIAFDSSTELLIEYSKQYCF